jgi:riboflavin kinase/FMN adenylyltransferase
MKVKAIVQKGEQRGRTLGFPTANLKVDIPKLHLKEGIYTSKAFFAGKVYKASTYIGPSSTFGKSEVLFEVYIHDFDAQIYHKELEVEILDFLRPPKKFDKIQDLLDQIAKDVADTEKKVKL